MSLKNNIFFRLIKRLLTELPLYFPVFGRRKKIENLIVSFTSYPARINTLHMVVRSLLRQSICAKNIVLYLGSDTPENAIPKKLKKLCKRGLLIKTGYEDLKPHKKYFFAMQEYPDNIIITVDDDIMYEKNMIEHLYNSYKKYPDAVSARRVTKLTKSENKINSYNDFESEYTKETKPSASLIAVGVGGVLYPPHILHKDAFNSELIKKTCLFTDDIWLKFMELKNNAKVVYVPSTLEKDLTVRSTQKSALMIENIECGNRNDECIKAIQNELSVNLAEFF